jgi:hypothetical protein
VTPVAIVYVERVVDGKATYRVAITYDGIAREPVGPVFDSPKEACRYADRMEAQARA